MKVLLLGLGRANLAIAKYLLAKGDELYLYEEKPESLADTAKDMIRTGRIRNFEDRNYDLVITSPGFPDSKAIINMLRARDMTIIDEIEFTYTHLNDPKVIAVTGTNGKSTTVAIISSILTSAGVTNFLGGNISPGTPFSHSLFEEPYEYYILEVSSFQLMRIKKFRPFIAVLTNIGIDHLNWHKSLNEYIEAKSRIFLNQDRNDYAVLNSEDENTKKIANMVPSKSVYFGRLAKNGAWLNGYFHFQHEEIFAGSGLPVTGEHNLLNILAAIAVSKILNINNKSIEQGIRDFKSLPHRLEDLGIIGGVHYINNSMCTNEMAAITSFKAVKGNKIIIAGGRPKGDRALKYLDLLIMEAKACVLMGDNAQDIAQYFTNKGYSRYKVAKDMNDAIIKSRIFASPGDTIMLNPGFASFGLFRDFADRGDAFKNGIRKNR